MAEPSTLPHLPEDWQRAMAVVAHPDDMEYGGSLAVARWTAQGKQVAYTLVTSGEAGIDSMPPDRAGPLRRNEQREACRAVGVDDLEFLDHRDGMIEGGLGLRRDLARAIRRHRPEILISINHRLTFGAAALNMADHRVVGMALLDAARDAGNRWIFPELMDEGHEPWAGVRLVAFGGSPEPTHAVDVTGYLDQGVASLSAHQVYIENLGAEFDPRSFLAAMAEGGGSRSGTDLGVAFEVIDV
jgi:LmbE family N-acetylglucosaminyl deacetylase